jgi:hypothetical protein
MKCPRCRHDNPPQSNFCLECGGRLILTYDSCGAGLPSGSKFCNYCGAPVEPAVASRPRFHSPEAYTPKHLVEKILTSKSALESEHNDLVLHTSGPIQILTSSSALEGERKQVTVLFADLKGSMKLIADLDPEEAWRILDPVLERMMEAVHHYEGLVSNLMGDGIMAIFGAPVAHEDHADGAAMTLASELQMRPLVAHCHFGLGRLYLPTDKDEQAGEHLTTATAMYGEMDMRFWLEQGQAELKGLG